MGVSLFMVQASERAYSLELLSVSVITCHIVDVLLFMLWMSDRAFSLNSLE